MPKVFVRGQVKKLEVNQGRLAKNKLYVNFKLAFTLVPGFKGQGSEEEEVFRGGKLSILIEKGRS